jgi:hypothetical protein
MMDLFTSNRSNQRQFGKFEANVRRGGIACQTRNYDHKERKGVTVCNFMHLLMVLDRVQTRGKSTMP